LTDDDVELIADLIDVTGEARARILAAFRRFLGR